MGRNAVLEKSFDFAVRIVYEPLKADMEELLKLLVSIIKSSKPGMVGKSAALPDRSANILMSQ